MFEGWKHSKLKRKINNQIKNRLANRIFLKEKYNIHLNHFEMTAVYMKAIQSCKDWHY